MTREEAEIVTKIMLTADHWCSSCSSDLLDDLKRAFPEHATAVDEVAKQCKSLEEAHRAAMNEWRDEYGFEGPPETKPCVWKVATA